MRKLNRLTMTLALLITAVSGAWAGEEPQLLTTINASSSFLTGSQTFDDIATVTFGGAGTIAFNNNNGWIQNEYNKEATVTVTAVDGYTITSIKIYSATSSNATISTSPFTAYLSKEGSSTFVMTGANGLGQYVGDELVRIEVYGYQPEPEITEWSLTPDTDKKVWTLANMPANDVELQVEYFAESHLFLSKDALADKDNIVVTAGKDPVTFGDDGKSAKTVTEGSAMTVKFNGTKKVLGMKVKKKGAASKLASEVTTDDIFKVIASDGMIYDNIAAAESAGTVAQGLVVYVGSNTGNDTYKHGMALALKDEGDYTWSGAKDACNAKNTSTPIVGALWIQASKDQWNTMFNAVGGDSKLRDCFSSAGGTNLIKIGNYWTSSSHEDSGQQGDYYTFSDNNLSGSWCSTSVYYNNDYHVRACIVF